MKQLVVNGDDFGMSPAVNAAVIRAHKEGILTSASLMVTAPAAAEAIALAKAMPSLRVGLHLVLVQGRAALSPERIPGLTDAAGSFTNDPVAAGMRYFFLPGLREQLRQEIAAQLAAFRDSGLPLDHVDGHLNIHMHPTVLGVLLELAERFGIRAVRVTEDEFGTCVGIDPRHQPRKLAESVTFRNLSRAARPRLRRLGIRYADRVYGLLQSGDMNEDFVIKLLGRIRVPTAELYFHPATERDAEVVKWMPDYHHVEELQALTSGAVRGAVEELGFRLAAYGELRA